MTEVTPELQALYALDRKLPRGDLPMAAQLEYDRLRPAWEQALYALDRKLPRVICPCITVAVFRSVIALRLSVAGGSDVMLT